MVPVFRAVKINLTTANDDYLKKRWGDLNIVHL
jgi:hypothetical protein